MAIVQETPQDKQQSGGALPEQPQKLGGVFWWLMLGLMVISDVGCALSNLLIAGGTALTATALGAPVGIPLAILGWIGSSFLTFNAFMFSTGYYFMNKVPLMEARKLSTMGVSVIMKLIPFINILPTITISFIVVTMLENAKRGRGLLGGTVGAIAQKAMSKAGPIGAVAAKVV
jgi:hypothetical protein